MLVCCCHMLLPCAAAATCCCAQGFLVNADLERDIWAKGFSSLAASLAGGAAGGGGGTGGSRSKASLDYRSYSLLLTEPLFNFDSVRGVTEEVGPAAPAAAPATAVHAVVHAAVHAAAPAASAAARVVTVCSRSDHLHHQEQQQQHSSATNSSAQHLPRLRLCLTANAPSITTICCCGCHPSRAWLIQTLLSLCDADCV